MENRDDVSSSYMAKSQGASLANDSAEMEGWLQTYDPKAQTPAPLSIDESGADRPLPKAPPLRRKTDDTLGRLSPEKSLDESAKGVGTIMRSVSEMPKQIVGGVDDAARNALSILNPLTDWLNENVADLTYDPVSAPKTGTGAITRKMSEFLTGFIPAMKGLGAIGVTNKIAAPILAGAMADFAVRNPQEGRLADLWKSMELPKNVLTEFLASDPKDSAMEGRFKNALEGAGLGVLTEGVMMGARAIRAIKGVRGVKQTEDAFLKGKYGEVTDADLKAANLYAKEAPPPVEAAAADAGEGAAARVAGTKAAKESGVTSPLIEHVPSKPEVAAKKLARGAAETATTDPRALIRAQKGAGVPEFDTYINFARIEEPDQVKFVIGKMAEKLKGTIDEATRGTITQRETQALADDLGMTVTDLLARRVGQVFNAEEALAARQIWAASGEKLLEAAKKANSPNAGALDMFAFRKMMATHAAVQAEVIGARTETARALASWAIPAGGSVEKARAIEQVMGAMGGTQTTKELAKRLAMLAEAGADPAAIGKYAEQGWGATSMDAIKEVWVNGLLSSPKTHVVNISSNTFVAMQQIYERAAAGGVRAFTGGEGAYAGESLAMAYGMVEASKDAWRLAAKALKTGQTGWSLNKMDLPRTNAVSAEAFRMSKETAQGRFVDFLGTATNVPGRLLGAEDEFFKTIGYRMELHAQAFRTASQEGLKGVDFGRRMADILRNPPEHIRINAADAALYSTFTNEVGNIGKAVMNARDRVPAITFVLPFVRTPVNIARYAFERTPLAPLVGQWRADIAAGGARADLALARMSTGTAIMLTAMDMADSGTVSGQGPKNQDKDTREAMMRQGWQPYSIKVGDRWVSYNRLDPLGTTMGFAADIADAVKQGELDQDDVDEWQEVMAMSIAAVSQVTISKNYLQGMANLVEVISDPRRYSQKYVSDMFASFLPGTALSAAVKNVQDPIQRESNTPMEAVRARIAALSESLPPRRNLWGEPISSESGLGTGYDFLSPATSKEEKVNPIDHEIVRLNQGPLRITKKAPFDGVMANMRPYPKVYDEYTRLAGNELKHPAWGVGAKDFLNSVVDGKHPLSAAYNVMSDESRKAFITSTINDYRKQSQRQIMADPRYKNFAAEITRLKEIHQGAKMPVLGE